MTFLCTDFLEEKIVVIPWIVKELDTQKLADVIVETYLQFVMSRVLQIFGYYIFRT